MDQVHVVRHKVRGEERTRRSMGRELGMSRATARKTDEGASTRQETAPRERPVWEAWLRGSRRCWRSRRSGQEASSA